MAQRIFQFRHGRTNHTITAHAGLVIFAEFINAVGLFMLINNELSKPGSPHGYEPARFIEPLILMQHGGGLYLKLNRLSYDFFLRAGLKIMS